MAATGGDGQEAAGVDGRLEALVLAAGSGSRFGGAKLLAPWRGGALLDGALSAAFAAPARTVTLVTGAHAEGVGAAAERVSDELGEAGRLRLVHAKDHAAGLSASLKAGIASLPPDTAWVFVFLGDMPQVPATMAGRLVEAQMDGALAAAPVLNGVRGHPVLMSRALFEAVAQLDGDRGAGAVLAGLGGRLALVETDDPGVLRDIDRPGDLWEHEA